MALEAGPTPVLIDCPICGSPFDSSSSECPACGERRWSHAWRHRRRMIVRNDSRLPPICVISGEPTDRRERIVFRAHRPFWIHVFVFLSCIPPTMFVALPLLLGFILFRVIPRVEIDAGLTEASAHRLKVRKRLWLIPPVVFV